MFFFCCHLTNYENTLSHKRVHRIYPRGGGGFYKYNLRLSQEIKAVKSRNRGEMQDLIQSTNSIEAVKRNPVRGPFLYTIHFNMRPKGFIDKNPCSNHVSHHWHLFASLATFDIIWQLFSTFVNFTKSLVTFLNFFPHLFVTFVSVLPLLLTFGNPYQLFRTSEHFWQILANFDNFGIFQKLQGFVGNYWQLLS